jgi:serine/threonine protein kinase
MSGMPEYMAPEILFQQECNHSVDLWCLGSILHEMVTGFVPFFS